MRMLLPSLKGSLGILPSLTLLEAAQIPFQAHKHSAIPDLEGGDNNWDISRAPNENATGHLVFETVNSFMQHWPNTRYRTAHLWNGLGHSIVPGVVPPGTVLYHGRGDANTPSSPEWLATDPEHSYMFCRGQTADTGCWQLTVTAIRPLKVLYFDGSSAAKMQDGSMDSQDIIAYGKVVPEKFWSERERIKNLCDWGNSDFEIDGFVRMEMDFEIMLCDFNEGVLVEPVNLRARHRSGRWPGGPGRGPPGPGRHLEHLDRSSFDQSFNANTTTLPSSGFDAFHSGTWHRYYPGDTRIQLDLTRLVSFYDTDLVPSLVPERYGKERIKHRLLGISPKDLQAVVRKIEELSAVSNPGSGVDWATLIRLIVKRYSERLEMVQYMLNLTYAGNSASQNKLLAENVQAQLVAMLQPYLLSIIKPSQDPTSTEWVSPMYKICATTYTNYIATSSLHSRLTSSEHLILDGIHETTKEICRVVTGMWVDGIMAGLEPDYHKPAITLEGGNNVDLESLLDSWKKRVYGLMKWLDWSVWLKCRPACGFEEMCYLPMWPFRQGSNESDDPQPGCVRRMASLDGQGS
ncbi:hypothetical protein GGU10DRAFT_333702 [Lentinula aff. detonsa]|uniref:Uncharacterized protein n=1 Tax=Lentinula aff. detonsa TaxID=2804958 RepID=A0AA38NLR1_9AGAR|nr:hypothetical protein GGU10DRAFT_333702 [Lentinula aff. detonsa]